MVFCGAGADTLYGWTGNDSLDGGTENDFKFGKDGAELMPGRATILCSAEPPILDFLASLAMTGYMAMLEMTCFTEQTAMICFPAGLGWTSCLVATAVMSLKLIQRLN